MPSHVRRLPWFAFSRFAAVVAASLLAHPAVAAVTFFGSVNPDPPGDGNVESTLVVGLAGDNDPDFRGFVQIDGGDQIEYDALIIGDDQGYRGEVAIIGELVPGRQSKLTLEEPGSTSAPTVQIGHEGVGRLTVSGGGSLILSNSSADLSLGVETSGVGTLTVTGPLSLVVVPDDHLIGDDGIGRMEVLDGGTVHTSDLTNTARVGATLSGSGAVLVDGPGSIWKIDDNLTIGGVGTGTVSVSNLGLIDADRPGAITTVGARGRLELDGGAFAGTSITVNGYLGGSGLIRGSVTNSVAAVTDVAEGQLLQFAGAVSNQGSIRIRGGEAAFLASFANLAAGSEAAPGRVTLESGRVRFSSPMTNGGVIAATSDVNHVHGAITNAATGAIVVASDTVATFYDSVDIGAGSLELLAGGNALLLADLTFSTGGAAALRVGDAATGTAQIHVSGAATLAGGLDVTLAGGFAPSSGDSFPLLLAADGVTGVFDSLALPTLGSGLSWEVDYGANDVVLNVLNAFTADFDADGDVDGDDLARWESAFGLNDSADADNDGDSDGSDFLAWQRQVGGGGASASAGVVPEPTTYALLIGWFYVGLLTRRRSLDSSCL